MSRRMLGLWVGFMLAVVTWIGCGSPKVTFTSSAQSDLSLPENVKRVAILNFRTVDGGRGPRLVDGGQITTQLIAGLAQEGYFQVVERTAVENIKEELAQSATVHFDKESQKQIGKLLNADALIFGTVKSTATENASKAQRTFNVQTGEFDNVPQYDQRGNIVGYYRQPRYRQELREVPTISREVNVYVDFRMINVETGTVIASLPKTKTERTQVFEGEYISRCPSHQVMADSAIKELLTSCVRYISPHRIEVQRYLLEGDGKLNEKGYELGRKGNWDVAKESWEAALRAKSDDAAALNNLGVYYERQGNNTEAFKYYNDAMRADPANDEIIENMQDFKARVYKRP